LRNSVFRGVVINLNFTIDSPESTPKASEFASTPQIPAAIALAAILTIFILAIILSAAKNPSICSFYPCRHSERAV
jgi:ABC-type lipoprotein release transport system permease subunit